MKSEIDKKKLIIRYAKKLNSTNLSPLRSGNISIRHARNKEHGFLITPSGMKYGDLKISDIVFVNLQGKFNKKKKLPSSEWHFHKDIYQNKKKNECNCSCSFKIISDTCMFKKKNSCFSLHGRCCRRN